MTAEGVAELVEKYLEEKGLAWSQASERSARGALQYFLKYLCQSDGALLRESVLGYAAHVERLRTRQGRPFSPYSKAWLLRSLQGFLRFLHQRGHMVLDLAALLRLPKLKHLPRPLPEAEVMKLLESGPGSLNAVRDRALLELLYGTGLRASEVARLEVQDVCFSERVVLVRQGKRRKDRVVPMGEHLAAALQDHLRGRAHPGRLFLTQAGRPLGRATLTSMLRRAARRAGLSLPVSPHRLRHSYATHLLRNGAPILAIKTLLGHETLLSTEVYLEVEVDDLRHMLRRSHPRGKGARIRER